MPREGGVREAGGAGRQALRCPVWELIASVES